jgi:hypothetical protein
MAKAKVSALETAWRELAGISETLPMIELQVEPIHQRWKGISSFLFSQVKKIDPNHSHPHPVLSKERPEAEFIIQGYFPITYKFGRKTSDFIFADIPGVPLPDWKRV